MLSPLTILGNFKKSCGHFLFKSYGHTAWFVDVEKWLRNVYFAKFAALKLPTNILEF